MAPRKKSMARSLSRDVTPATPVIKADTTRKGYAKERPPIPTKISLAYGAPGRVSMPQRLRPKSKNADVAEAIQEMLEEDETAQQTSAAELAQDEQQEEQVGAPEPSEKRADSEQEDEEQDEEMEDGGNEDIDQDEGGSEEQDEEQDREASSETDPTNLRKHPVINARHEFHIQPYDERRSFTTEAKIASEARIRRPTVPVRVRIRRLWGHVSSIWYHFGGETVLFGLTNFLKVFFILTIIVWSYQSLQPYAPTFKIPALPSIRSPLLTGVPSGGKEFLDNRALNTLQDLMTNRFNLLRHRIESVELSQDRLSRTISVPPPKRKVNFFAPGTGVVIDPFLTSPTRLGGEPSILEQTWTWLRGLPLKTSPQPFVALTSWDDMGDCWCAADSGGKSQIAVALPKMVVPQELVVEHISMEATIYAGAAPKDIELWAQILDPDRREAVEKAALYYKITSPDIQNQTEMYLTSRALDKTWVRIGRWQYNLFSPNNIQSFQIPVPLDHFSAPINKLAFRTLSNWGKADHVCLYRLKLHGLLANATAIPVPDEDLM